MANIDCVKLDDTAVRRIETDRMWNKIAVGDVVNLKFKSHSRGNTKKKFEYKKYKVLNKQHMKILVEKVDNRMKEMFTFADFLTGDVII